MTSAARTNRARTINSADVKNPTPEVCSRSAQP